MSHGSITRIEVFVTTQVGSKTFRAKMADGAVVKDHFQFQQSRPHEVKVKKGKHVFVPKAEVSLLLYVKYKPKKS